MLRPPAPDDGEVIIRTRVVAVGCCSRLVGVRLRIR